MKLSEQTIQTIANAVIANAQVLQSLIDSLPKEAKEEVAKVVNPTPVAAPVPAPVVEVAVAPVVLTPVLTPAPVVAPAVVVPVTPVAVVQPAVASPSNAPFSDAKGFISYIMASYQLMGAEKGRHIQDVLTANGYKNINEVKPESYPAIYAAIEALKV